ncbi:MAG: tRNA pseudouridine(13) synthase TruD [Moraxella sp.]|nr:tRNA pseudouridine(13) synthase TruD [Moraxella sp.]
MNLISPYAPTIKQATFKACADDFVVHEIMNIDFDHQGEHLWLFIQKTNLNTEFVARLLAKWTNITPNDVGFSGLKDRQAVTYQWFSLRLPKKQLPPSSFEGFAQAFLNDDESLNVIQQHWHGKKLHRGTHKANHFNITLKSVVGDKTSINEQLKLLQTQGVPNYFGEQRFGKNGNNLSQSTRFFEKLLGTDKPYRPHKKDRHKHALYISTAKSTIFNALLAKRVQMRCWDKPINGDVFNLNGTRSVFCADIDDTIRQRMTTGDIHPAGILYGTGKRLASSWALALENDVLAEFKLLVDGLSKIDAKLDHRPYRLMIDELIWQWQDDTLTLSFTLPTGSFATAVLFAISDDD